MRGLKVRTKLLGNFYLLLLSTSTAIFLSSTLHCTNSIESSEEYKSKEMAAAVENKKWQEHLQQAKQFIKHHNYNKRYACFVDLSIASSKQRFFVFDFESDTTILTGLVAHGSCNTDGLAMAQYSNQKGSGCSSLGKYKIGNKYHGRFGASYKLHGLDSSNSNAFDRAVVLHKYDCVPDYEMIEGDICNSLGCPMVSPNFFARLEKIIDRSKKPILLWMYE